MLILASALTIAVQFLLIHVQWESVISRADDGIRLVKPGNVGSPFKSDIADEA